MRLAQLARKIGVKPSEIATFLANKNLPIEESSNTKVSDDQVEEVLMHYAPGHLPSAKYDEPGIEPEEMVESTSAQQSIEIDDVVLDEPDKAEGVITKDNDTSIKEVIKPVLVELPGLKVVGKIDLPEPKKKEMERPEENRAAIEGGLPAREKNERPKGSRDVNRENERRPKKNVIALQREREAREALRRKEQKKEIDKEKKYSSIMKKTLLDVNALNIELKNIHDEQNNLMGILAHDLKNPLQSIISALKLMQSEKNDEQFRDEMESNIKHQSERMLILINRLLDHRSISEGSVKIKISEFNSKELISKLIKNSSISAVKKDINLISDCSECGITVKNDHDMLYQILENLLSNSVKFSPVGSDIYVRCRRSGDKNIFEIEDSGPGFTDEDKKKLYSNFAKLSAKPTGNEHSTGLGLSIVKKLCELIGAEIELFSEFGKGTKFIVKL